MSIPQSRDFSLFGGNCGCRASDRLPIPPISPNRATFGKRVADPVFTKLLRYSYRSACVGAIRAAFRAGIQAASMVTTTIDGTTAI